MPSQKIASSCRTSTSSERRHQKPNPQANQPGGIIERRHRSASNVNNNSASGRASASASSRLTTVWVRVFRRSTANRRTSGARHSYVGKNIQNRSCRSSWSGSATRHHAGAAHHQGHRTWALAKRPATRDSREFAMADSWSLGKPISTLARKSIATFKIRDGWLISLQGHAAPPEDVRVHRSPGQYLPPARAQPSATSAAVIARSGYSTTTWV